MSTSSDPSSLDPLLVHSGWAKQVAGRLLGDLHAGEDCVQESWLAALKHPLQDPSGAAAWLRKVVANFALQRRRADGRRNLRELAYAKVEGQPASDVLVQRMEIQQLLAREVLALPEVYRTTLILHFYDELSSAEIARRLGLPAGTVRARLHRGLELLRERWQRRFPAKEDWRAPLMLVWRAPQFASSALTATALGLGPIAALLTLFCVACAALLYGRFRPLPASSASGEPVQHTNPAQDARLAVPSHALGERSPAPAVDSVASLPASEADLGRGWWLQAKLQSVEGAKLDGVHVRVAVDSSPLGLGLEQQVSSDAEVWFDLEPLFVARDGMPLRLFVHADQPRCLPVSHEIALSRAQRQAGFLSAGGALFELNLKLEPAQVHLRGSWPIIPATMAFVALCPAAALVNEGELLKVTAWTDFCELSAGGEFHLRAPAAGDYWLVAAPDAAAVEWQPSVVRSCTLTRGEQWLELPAEAGCSLTGRLLLASEQSGAHCRLRVSPVLEDIETTRNLVWDGRNLVEAEREVEADERGFFRFLGISAGRWQLQLVGGAGGAPASAWWAGARASEGMVVVAPASGIQFHEADLVQYAYEFWRDGAPLRGVRSPGLAGVSNALGQWTLFAAPQSKGELSVCAPPSPLRSLEFGKEPWPVAEPTRVYLTDLGPRATLSLELVGDEERAVEAGVLELYPLGTDLDQAPAAEPPIWRGRVRRMAQDLSYADLPSGRWLARWLATGPGPQADEARTFCEERFSLELPPGASISRRISLRHGGWLRLMPRRYGDFQGLAEWSVRRADGSMLPLRFLSRRGLGTRPAARHISSDEELESASALPAGDYVFELVPVDQPLQRRAFRIVAGETTVL